MAPTLPINIKGYYSIRRKLHDYKGPVCSVCFSHPHSTVPFDIYVGGDGNGKTGTGSNGYVDKSRNPITFPIGRNVLVHTWYDQSGNMNHATMDDEPFQPYLDVYKKCLVFIHRRHLRLPDASIPSDNSDYSIIAHYDNIWNPKGAIVGSGQYGTSMQTNCLRRHGTGFCHYWWGNDAQVYNAYRPYSIVGSTYHSKEASRKIFVNDKLVYKSTDESMRNGCDINNTIGIALPDEGLDGELFTLIISDLAIDTIHIKRLIDLQMI